MQWRLRYTGESDRNHWLIDCQMLHQKNTPANICCSIICLFTISLIWSYLVITLEYNIMIRNGIYLIKHPSCSTTWSWCSMQPGSKTSGAPRRRRKLAALFVKARGLPYRGWLVGMAATGIPMPYTTYCTRKKLQTNHTLLWRLVTQWVKFPYKFICIFLSYPRTGLNTVSIT